MVNITNCYYDKLISCRIYTGGIENKTNKTHSRNFIHHSFFELLVLFKKEGGKSTFSSNKLII